MTMYEVPKMSTHPLDKYRNANIDYITSNSISGSTLSGSNIIAGTITGSTISGSNVVVNSLSGSTTISGAAYQGPLVTSILSSGAAVTGQITITTGAGLNITQTGNQIVISLA